MDTTKLVKQAQDRQFTDFSDATKEILKQRVQQKMQEKGYIARLAAAKLEETPEIGEE